MKKGIFPIDRQKITGLVSTLLFLAAGILLLVRPQLTADLAVWVLSLVLLAVGIVLLVRYIRSSPEEGAKSYDLAESLVAFSAAAVFFLRQDLFSLLLPLLWGALLILGGFMLLQTAFDFFRFRYIRWWILLIGAGVALALGTLALMRPPLLAERMPLFIGISLVAEGGFNLFSLVLMFLRSREKLPLRGSAARAAAKKAAAEPSRTAAPYTMPTAEPTAREANAAPSAQEPPAPQPKAPEREAPATVMEELARMREEEAKKAEKAD